MHNHFTIKLMTTLGCHLCEEAHTMLVYCQEQGLNFDILPVEISESEELVENYGVRIPVLQHSAHNQELGWPFDMDQLQRFLSGA